jgi:hypothetical protein
MDSTSSSAKAACKQRRDQQQQQQDGTHVERQGAQHAHGQHLFQRKGSLALHASLQRTHREQAVAAAAAQRTERMVHSLHAIEHLIVQVPEIAGTINL